MTLLLRALGRRNELHDTERSVSCVEDLGTEILSNEVYAADLEHFLLCLQRRLFDALLRRSLNELEEKAIEWQKYWQQLRKLGSWWFFEWPSGRRPLSTTWPWNVKPSLMVLWGVCWMFYDEKPKSSIPADVFLGNDAFLEYMPQRMPWPDESKFAYAECAYHSSYSRYNS